MGATLHCRADMLMEACPCLPTLAYARGCLGCLETVRCGGRRLGANSRCRQTWWPSILGANRTACFCNGSVCNGSFCNPAHPTPFQRAISQNGLKGRSSPHSSGVRRPGAIKLTTQPDHNPARVAPEATASGLGNARHRMTGTKLTAPPLALSW